MSIFECNRPLDGTFELFLLIELRLEKGIALDRRVHARLEILDKEIVRMKHVLQEAML